MLTKNLLRCNIGPRKTVTPSFIDPENPSLLRDAEALLSCIHRSLGMARQDFEEKLSEDFAAYKQNFIFLGIKKLALDRCFFEDADDVQMIESRRWLWFLHAQKLRQEITSPHTEDDFRHLFLNTKPQLESNIENHRNLEDNSFSESETQDSAQDQLLSEINNHGYISEHSSQHNALEILYADLPEYQILKNFKNIHPESLLHRYNCALIQGLLLNCTQLKVSIKNSSLAKNRALFRLQRFFQLIVKDIQTDKENLSMTIEGPLSVFEKQNTYGMRIAQFFPFLLQMDWFIEADLDRKGSRFVMSLNFEKNHIRSHVQDLTTYIPNEFKTLCDKFTEKYQDKKFWSMNIAHDILHIETQHFCFPDFVFEHHQKDHKIYLECFHRWHKTALILRLNQIQRGLISNVYLAIASDLTKNSDVQEAMKNCEDSNERFLIFKDFPSMKSLELWLQKRES